MKNQSENGSALVIAVFISLIAVLGLLGFITWNNFFKPKASPNPVDTSLSQQNVTLSETSSNNDYDGWQTYKSDNLGYTLQYPAGWALAEAPQGATSLAIASTSFSPPGGSAAVVTVSAYKSTQSPRDFILSNSLSQIIDSDDRPINGYGAYYSTYGDGTFVNLTYAISNGDIVVTVSMTKTSNTPQIDNSAYIDEYDLLAHSIKL